MLQNWQNSNGELIDPNANPEKDVIETDTRLRLSEVLQKAIRQLPLKQEKSITLRFNGLSSAEAAKEMGVGVDTLKTHVRKAHFRLLSILSAGAMATLPEYKVSPLQLHLEGATYEKIAKKLGYVSKDGGPNVSAVKTRIQLSKRQLYRALTADDGFHALID